MAKKIESWQAEDGKLFTSQLDAEEYDRKCKFMNTCTYARLAEYKFEIKNGYVTIPGEYLIDWVMENSGQLARLLGFNIRY